VGLGALIPESLDPPPPSPLHLKLVDESWQLLYDAVWVFGLAVRVTNLTDEPVILTRYYVKAHIVDVPEPPYETRLWNRVIAIRRKLKSDHRSELFAGEITLPPLGSITRWHVDTTFIPLPNGGRPRLTFGMKDTLDNQYRLEVPARAPETYHS
jgi:hypothetical protein